MSPDSDQRPRRATCPVPKIAIAAMRFTDTARVFADFTFDPRKERGGHPLRHPTYFSNDNKHDENDTHEKEYGTETSFSPEQLVLAEVAVKKYTSLVSGHIRGRPDILLPNFSQRVQNAVEMNGAYRVADAVIEAHDEVLHAMATHHPTFMPAFEAVINLAGAAGFEVVLNRTRDFAMLAKNPDSSVIHGVAERRTDEWDFHRPHPIASRNKTGEVGCMATIAARTMIVNTAHAVVELKRRHIYLNESPLLPDQFADIKNPEVGARKRILRTKTLVAELTNAAMESEARREAMQTNDSAPQQG